MVAMSPEIPGSPSYLRKGTPTLARFLLDLGYTTGEFGKNHLGDHTESLPTANGFQEFWGYLYHLDAQPEHKALREAYRDGATGIPADDIRRLARELARRWSARPATRSSVKRSSTREPT